MEQAEQARIVRGKKKRTFELNLAPEYWSKRFLYPYQLDLAPLRLPQPNQMDTFNFQTGTTANGVAVVGPKILS